MTGGSKKTVEFARQHGKPVLHLFRDCGPPPPEVILRHFIQDHDIKVLNVAGPRASKEPDVGAFIREVLGKMWPPQSLRGVPDCAIS